MPARDLHLQYLGRMSTRRKIKGRVTTATLIYDRCNLTIDDHGVTIQVNPRRRVVLAGAIEMVSRDEYTLTTDTETITIARQGGCGCGGGNGRVLDAETLQPA